MSALLALSAYILTVDRAMLVNVVAICVFVSIALVSMLSRDRRVLELVALFVIALVVLLVVAIWILNHVLALPFLRLETVHVGGPV